MNYDGLPDFAAPAALVLVLVLVLVLALALALALALVLVRAEWLRTCLTWCLRTCLAECSADFVDLVDVAAGLVFEGAGAFGVVCAAGALGVAGAFGVEFDCAKAGPAIRAVATSAAANLFNMVLFLFVPRRRFGDRAVFKHLFKDKALNRC